MRRALHLAVRATVALLVCIAPSMFPAGGNAAAADKPAGIARTLDASRYTRAFPDLVAHRNTSIQKAPAPVLAELSEKELGRPKVTRCWLNLDEMWDYRTRKFDYNYVIGSPRYADVEEKFQESWGWVEATNVRFDDYLKAFGRHSDAVMLTIRRYERDILDGKLGVTMADWKMIFRSAVKHAKEVCPNVRYIEVCNEYGCKGFIGCTHDEYYRFYQLAYQAVNEVNAEMKLTGKDRILVGGPNAVRTAMTALDRFFENFANDPATDKRLDFVTWHEYHNRYAETAGRQKQVEGMLSAHGLPTGLPMFITEHDPYHPKAGKTEFNLINGAGLVKSLYFTNRNSPRVGILPWVLYHDRDIQTRFMWFDGPNEPDTRIDQLRMLPAGCSMKMLAMHKEWEIDVDNAVDRDEVVLASVGKDGLAVEAVNYGQPRPVRVQLDNLPAVFTALGSGKVKVVTYLIDEKHSNCVADPDYPGGLDKVNECMVQPNDGSITLSHPQLAQNGLLMWMVIPEKVGNALPVPASAAKPAKSETPADAVAIADARRKAKMSADELAWEKVLEENLGGFYLPIYKKQKMQGRTTAWDYVVDDPALPRVLLIGDSVSRGYTQAARQALAGKVNLHRAPANCGSTAVGLKKLDVWLGDGRWDVIHFNFGLHDLHAKPADYRQRLEQIVARLKKSGAQLIWAHTTPVPDVPKKRWKPAAPIRLNEIAAEVMKQHGVAVNDLHAWIEPTLAQHQNPGDIHFNGSGYGRLGEGVARAVEATISKQGKH